MYLHRCQQQFKKMEAVCISENLQSVNYARNVTQNRKKHVDEEILSSSWNQYRYARD